MLIMLSEVIGTLFEVIGMLSEAIGMLFEGIDMLLEVPTCNDILLTGIEQLFEDNEKFFQPFQILF